MPISATKLWRITFGDCRQLLIRLAHWDITLLRKSSTDVTSQRPGETCTYLYQAIKIKPTSKPNEKKQLEDIDQSQRLIQFKLCGHEIFAYVKYLCFACRQIF